MNEIFNNFLLGLQGLLSGTNAEIASILIDYMDRVDSGNENIQLEIISLLDAIEGIEINTPEFNDLENLLEDYLEQQRELVEGLSDSDRQAIIQQELLPDIKNIIQEVLEPQRQLAEESLSFFFHLN